MAAAAASAVVIAAGWLAMPPQLQELSVHLTELGWQTAEEKQDIQPVVVMQLT